MKKLSIALIAIVLAVCVIFSSTATVIGDIDADGKVQAADARLVLRASVGLEQLSEEQLANADADGDGKIGAGDARLILRASVGLGTLPHVHTFENWETTTASTCAKKGTQTAYCECGETSTRDLDFVAHSFKDGICTECQAKQSELAIPRMDFTGNISGMNDKKDERVIEISYVSDEVSFTGAAKIKVQGNSSLAYDKKNYTIKLYTDSTTEKKMKVDVGWGKQNKYCLKANWIDKTHSRNIITANVFSDIQHKYGLFDDSPANNAIDGFPIEIYANGEFLGIYTFNIPKDAWMFNMDEDNPNHMVFCSEQVDSSNSFKALASFDSWALEVGEEDDEKLAKLNRLFSFIMSSSDEEFKKNIHQYMNLDSLLNYLILMDFAYLIDNNTKNMLLVTYDGEIWYASHYDLDTSWGAHWNGSSVYDYHATDLYFTSNVLWQKVYTNFTKELSERYFELREEILTKENIMGKFNSFKNSIPAESFEKEAAKWGKNIPGFDIDQIDKYLDDVIPKLDKKYSTSLFEVFAPNNEETTAPEETTAAPEETTTATEETTAAPEETTTATEETTAAPEETTTVEEATTAAEETTRLDS